MKRSLNSFTDRSGCTPRTTKAMGDAAEDDALRHLQAQGLRLLESHYRTPGRGGGEIDHIMRAPDGTVVFVEVRWRRTERYGGALASVTATKQRRLIWAARHYLRRFSTPPPCRFDVVGLGPQGVVWIQGAFDA
ncbi:MAG: YraN family protein [Limnohabitans sp.]|jgi:putative endonuclease|nr:YraN family protein [Limnohabitans sp.]